MVRPRITMTSRLLGSVVITLFPCSTQLSMKYLPANKQLVTDKYCCFLAQ